MITATAHWWRVASFVAAAVVAASTELLAEMVEKTTTVAGTAVRYRVVLPDGYRTGAEYPAVLVFGGGPQTMNTVETTLSRNFRAEAERRGYIVIAPAAPAGELFFENGARIFPEFLKTILAEYRIVSSRFHVAGPSNGGIAAFHVAAANPQYFVSVTAFPGYLWQPTPARLQAISKMCVFMYVGELDDYMWHGEMKREADILRASGTLARYTVEKGQPHRIETLAGTGARRLFNDFDEARNGCTR
jgi:poly(3-hydroxybutyrate) depolymerase